jgi:hypothetical protein
VLVLAWLLAMALTLRPVRTWAQPAPELPRPDADRPWATGVSERDQSAALEVYVAGNHDIVESRFGDALDKYKLAIKLWDHPAITTRGALSITLQPASAVVGLGWRY